jgi:hypothetical protein
VGVERQLSNLRHPEFPFSLGPRLDRLDGAAGSVVVRAFLFEKRKNFIGEFGRLEPE